MRDRIRYTAQVAAFRGTLRVDHGGQRIPCLFFRRLPRDAPTFLCRSREKMLVWNHGYGFA